MKHIISIIQETVKDDAAQGKTADVDAYCDRFSKMRPDLSRKDIEDIVLDALASFGTGAVFRGGSKGQCH